MRNTLLATAAIAALALNAPAIAQTPDQPADQPADQMAAPDGGMAPHPKAHHHHKMAITTGDEKFAHEPGTGESGPASMKASNINQSDSHSDIAPHLPMPKAGHDASADAYLGAAQRALRAHRTGEAQQALEMAETRLLDRSTPAGTTAPMQNPQIEQISMARQALGHGDMRAANNAIKTALGANGDASEPGAGPGSMGSSGSGASSMRHDGMNGSGDMSGSTAGASITPTNTAPTGTPGMATSGAGPTPGASAGASVAGGAAGTGTADSAGGAK